MTNKIKRKSKVISLLSGKGGAGKTSVAIGQAYMLNDMGFRVLLIDFDFATNGASYFYKYLYSRQKKCVGLYEIIYESDNIPNVLKLHPEDIHVEIKDGLTFIPSRVNFSKKLPLSHSLTFVEETLKSFLRNLIKSHKDDYDIIIIDNQAGSNITAKVSASLSNKVIIVSELDPISSDTVDTLLIQIGDALPEYRRYLINKLDIRESENYNDLSTLFQSMNRLPPLPFDFEVRAAFASRQVPIDMNKPTTFLIALFNTVRAFLPEYGEEMEKYGEKILSRYNEYQDKVEGLLDRKREIQDKIENLKKKRLMIKFMFRMVVPATIAIGVVLFTLFTTKRLFLELGNLSFLVSIAAGLIMVMSVFAWSEYRGGIERVTIEDKLKSEMGEINKEVDRYKTLMLTRTKEFLLHFEKQTED